jgi:hypothetical protein
MGAAVVYLKSFAAGLLASLAAIALQSVVFYRSWSFSDAGFVWAETSSTDVYLAPVVIAFAAGSLVAWWRLRTKTLPT